MRQHKPSVRGLAMVCRVVVGGLMAYAAYLKFQGIPAFADGIKAFKILPDHLVYVSAFAFPWIEAIAGVLLVLGLWTRGAALVCVGLLGAFLFAIISVMVRGVVVTECSCFGKTGFLCSGPPSWCHVAQDVILLSMSLVVCVVGCGFGGVDRVLYGRSGGSGPGAAGVPAA
ncbi:MAG: DoxX family membrane protein [Phycisphaerales bacterium]|nr:DoxX family membrane protein [Phycisphaerales bacterium]